MLRSPNRLRSIAVTAVCVALFTIRSQSSPAFDQSSTSSGFAPPAVLGVVDNALRRMGEPTADYRQIFAATISALQTEQGATARTSLSAFLARAPASGPDFGCNAEFMRRTARKALLRLRSNLAGERPQPVDPEVCYATPAALDLQRILRQGDSVDIYGFDLDEVSLQLGIVTANGFVDITPALHRLSHYHLVAELRPGAAALPDASRSLAIVWGHVIRYSVPIVSDTTPLCSSAVETVPRGAVVTYARSMNAIALRGQVSVDVSLEYSSNKLEAVMCVIGDDPAVNGCTTAFLYTTDADSEIEGILGVARSRLTAPGRGRPAPTNQARNGPVRRWILPGDPRRPIDVDDASVAAQLGEIRLVSTRDGACVSPITYQDSRRTTTFEPGLRRALDRQLLHVDSRIRKLRPQFALPR